MSSRGHLIGLVATAAVGGVVACVHLVQPGPLLVLAHLLFLASFVFTWRLLVAYAVEFPMEG